MISRKQSFLRLARLCSINCTSQPTTRDRNHLKILNVACRSDACKYYVYVKDTRQWRQYSKIWWKLQIPYDHWKLTTVTSACGFQNRLVNYMKSDRLRTRILFWLLPTLSFYCSCSKKSSPWGTYICINCDTLHHPSYLIWFYHVYQQLKSGVVLAISSFWTTLNWSSANFYTLTNLSNGSGRNLLSTGRWSSWFTF